MRVELELFPEPEGVFRGEFDPLSKIGSLSPKLAAKTSTHLF